jgi:hypothetical protein
MILLNIVVAIMLKIEKKTRAAKLVLSRITVPPFMLGIVCIKHLIIIRYKYFEHYAIGERCLFNGSFVE